MRGVNAVKKSRGFTLIELLVTIALLAVLIAGFIVLINPIGQFQKARDSKRKGSLHQIETALQTYYTEKGGYPASVNNQISGAPWGFEWLPYIGKVPQDPLPQNTYVYQSDTSEGWFRLYAKLERCDDPQIIPEVRATCATISCNYSVSSTNTPIVPFSGTGGCTSP